MPFVAVALTLALSVVAAEQTPTPAAKRWADIQAPEAWTEIFVKQVIPGAGDVASSVDFALAKHVMFRSSLSGEWVSVVAVQGPDLQTYFLSGGEIFFPDSDGMTSFWVALGQLTLARSFQKVPSTAKGITTFLSLVTEQSLAEESRKYSYVSLAAAAPEGFFVRGSQPVSADLRGFDVRDGVLRLALRSHDGRIGSFWVNLSTLEITKTEFGYPMDPSATDPVPHIFMVPTLPVTRGDLAKPGAWRRAQLELVVPASPTGAMKVEKTVVLASQLTAPHHAALAAIVDPRSGNTYVVHSGQYFYLVTETDLLAFSITGFFHSDWSYFKAKTAPGDPAATIARFVAEVDDESLAVKIRNRSSIDLRRAAPFRFFAKDASGPGNLITTAIHLNDGVLRLDLLSDGGKYQGAFWIDLKAQRLLRSVIDGKEFFKAK